ncbi:ComEA family DNA-binding protein [Paenibacillus validus]|uniref:Helix-hairpin-helix domain-containing protein n=1 Tax=Paenibacillus validus TaxID=44253 RepID=A0A7X3CTX7_9BACL|nr:helix-hairpin-helix domain-containing protein [Paenibacillus validus]MUG72176.1 helix-hairpin-helix domain-containing protein [Paenibacillus validus]
MQSKTTQEAIIVLKESIKELESSKASVLVGIQKLLRVSKMINDESCIIWCEIQMGNTKYIKPLENYIEILVATNKSKTKINIKKLTEVREELKKLQVDIDEHCSLEELNVKANKSGGGYINIGFIEERYNDLVRTKKGNDGTFYKNNLNNHLNYVRKTAHEKASLLYNTLAFSDAPQSAFDILKIAIDDKLLDINPELAEKLMQAFKSVSTDNPEEWSHALTSCRRLIENLAAELSPATDELYNGRSLGRNQYINRVWAFMDKSISSESNRDLAKTHVDFVGSYLQRLHKLTNKGVHAQLSRAEAIKAVFHIYLICASILEYHDEPQKGVSEKMNIHTASLDELEAVLDINRNMAKEIVKMRVAKGRLSLDDISTIKGVGAKTISKFQDTVSFD